MTPPKPSRRRLTEAEFEAELARARGGDWRDEAKVHLDRLQSDVESFIVRSSRRRSWWQRGWKR